MGGYGIPLNFHHHRNSSFNKNVGNRQSQSPHGASRPLLTSFSTDPDGEANVGFQQFQCKRKEGVGQCPNFSHHPTIGDIISYHLQILVLVMWNKSPKRDISQALNYDPRSTTSPDWSIIFNSGDCNTAPPIADTTGSHHRRPSFASQESWLVSMDSKVQELEI